MYNTIVRAPFGHPEVPVRRLQSVSSKIYKRRAFRGIVGGKEDDRDEDAVTINTVSCILVPHARCAIVERCVCKAMQVAE